MVSNHTRKATIPHSSTLRRGLQLRKWSTSSNAPATSRCTPRASLTQQGVPPGHELLDEFPNALAKLEIVGIPTNPKPGEFDMAQKVFGRSPYKLLQALGEILVPRPAVPSEPLALLALMIVPRWIPNIFGASQPFRKSMWLTFNQFLL